MINSQWKALHLGRWELLFKIMDEGSITRVADIENLQRSQLSRMVSGLEEELGVQLLERRGKRLNPTQVALELRSKIEPHIVRVRRALGEDLGTRRRRQGKHSFRCNARIPPDSGCSIDCRISAAASSSYFRCHRGRQSKGVHGRRMRFDAVLRPRQ